MKKAIVILFFFLSGLGLATAQSADGARTREPRTPEERAEMRTKRLTKALSLTEAQTAQVKTIFLEQAQQMDQLQAKRRESTEKGAVRGEAKTLADATDQKLKGVLTPEQFTKYQTLQQERTERRQDPQTRRRGRR